MLFCITENTASRYLTLSLISPLFKEPLISLVEDGALPLNYGLNKVRMLAPVTVGSRIRDRKDPALYAETLHLFYNG